MKNLSNSSEENVLTSKMDVGSKGFNEFQAILLNKSKQRSEVHKQKIELLTLQYQMEDYINSKTETIKSAGEFLKTILKTLHIQQNKFANYVGLKPSNLSKLLSGERPINYDLAIIFGKIFNHNPMLWIEIQAKNELIRLIHSDTSKYSDYSLNGLIDNQQKAV